MKRSHAHIFGSSADEKQSFPAASILAFLRAIGSKLEAK
jgi:hypothetical protein